MSGESTFSLKQLFKGPALICSYIAVAIFLSPFRFPAFIQDALSTIGNMTVPLSMILIGCQLAGVRYLDILRDGWAYVVSFLRLLALPILMMFCVSALPIPATVARVTVVMTALPCGSINAILAEQYECEPEYAARTVVQSMVLMCVTIPVVISLMNIFLPA